MSTIKLNDSIEKLLFDLKNAKTMAAQLNSRIEAYEQTLKDYMQDNEVLVDNDGVERVTWIKDKDSWIIDSKLLQSSMPEVYKQFAKIKKGGRRFLVK